MKNCDPIKWWFVEDQLIANSIHAAFQRANVYRDSKAFTDSNRLRVRERLADLLKEVTKQYGSDITDAKHKENIKHITDTLTAEFKDKNLLKENRFRIGISQKALNLYLKYLWCLGKIPTPPHCPFDFGIISKLPLNYEEKKRLQWTELDSLEGYSQLVDAAKKKIKLTGDASISEWELKEWNKNAEQVNQGDGE